MAISEALGIATSLTLLAMTDDAASIVGGHAARPYTHADDAASHIGVFGEGSGEGVFAKTTSPATS